MGKISVLTSALIMTFSGQLYASSLITLADHGGVSVKSILSDEPQTTVNSRLEIPKAPNVKSSDIAYPVITPEMKVGPIGVDEAKNINASYLTFPIFIIGYDRVSAKWLQNNLEYLESKKAVGLVVNIQNAAQMKRLKELAKGKLVLQPTPGGDLSQAIGLKHYPAYIDQDGLGR